jgi:hypothetical protein
MKSMRWLMLGICGLVLSLGLALSSPTRPAAAEDECKRDPGGWCGPILTIMPAPTATPTQGLDNPFGK